MYSAVLRKWIRKFRLAGRGVAAGIKGQNSFLVHVPVAITVICLATVLKCQVWQWCVLLLCIGMVLTAELANSAIEELAAGLCREHNSRVGRALDIASGAVLVASVTAAIVGGMLLLSQFLAISYNVS